MMGGRDPPGFYPDDVSLESRAQRLVGDHAVADALSITDLYARVDRAVRTTFPDEVWITGEIRSLKVNANGHCFIDLVDPGNAQGSGAPQLSVKCWANRWRTVRTNLERLGINLEAGMVVRARGEVEFYKVRGTVDFKLSELDTDALMGKVAAERARLIQALVDENLFDRQRRMRVAPLPLRVGLVASPGTEGYRDFLGGLQGSGLAFDVSVAPTAVQGKDAPAMVAGAIRDLQSRPIDVIVVVRGGGSKADLAAFDQEAVARAVAGSDVPVWTGIGHTGDLSVADEVANRAFITPTECGQELARVALDFWRHVESAGASLARVARDRIRQADKGLAAHQRAMSTGARNQLDRHADGLAHRARGLRTLVRSQVDTHAERLVVAGSSTVRAAERAVRAEGDALGSTARRLSSLPARRLEVEGLRAAQRRRLLGAYDYQRQLERGYSVTRDGSGAVLRSVSGLAAGAGLVTQLADGTVTSTVTGDPTTSAGPADPTTPQNDQPEGTQ
jgi:exodeoxyribonuclease VII large subunit